MVVSQDDRTSGVFDRATKDFSGMNQRCVKRANGDLMAVDDLVLRVHRDDVKFFLQAVGHQPGEVPLTECDRFFAAADFDDRTKPCLRFLNSTAKFNADLEPFVRFRCQSKFVSMGLIELVDFELTQNLIGPIAGSQQHFQKLFV